MQLAEQKEYLIDLGKKIKGDDLQASALRDSIFELTYILQRTQELAPALEIEVSSAGQK